MKTKLKILSFRLYKFLKRLFSFNKNKNELDLLYRILYDQVHNFDESMEITSKKNTQETFAKQWEKYKEGYYLLSDPWFKKNLTRIICEEEILIHPDWFRGKEILDAGCGNGRWTHGLCKLEAKVTSVDINIEAIEEAKKGISELENKPNFVNTSLEEINQNVNGSFDLVFSSYKGEMLMDFLTDYDVDFRKIVYDEISKTNFEKLQGSDGKNKLLENIKNEFNAYLDSKKLDFGLQKSFY